MDDSLTKIGNYNQKFIGYLILIRTIAIVGQITTIAFVHFYLAIPLPLKQLFTIISIMSFINLLTFVRLRFIPKISNQFEIFCQLLIDIFSLAGILYFVGGASNPFASLFILQVIIASTILSNIYIFSLLLITSICYSLLLYYNQPIFYLSHYHIDNFFNLHINGMWINFVLTSFLVSFFIVKMSRVLRERDHLLALTRERLIKDEHIIKLGAIAAGAAHELGTPLGTIAILNKELIDEFNSNSEVSEKLHLIKSQLERCKSSLSNLNLSVGELRAEGGGALPLDDYLKLVIDKWQGSNNQINLCYNCQGHSPAPVIVSDKLLEQIIFNLLDNARQAAKSSIYINADWDNSNLELKIRDDGEGIPENLLLSLGKTPVTTKENGQGLGIYLTNSIITKLGGSFVIENIGKAMGAQATVKLPLDKIKV